TPSGPVPRTSAKSTPNSFARRRAFGEISGGALATAVFVAAAAWVAARVCCAPPLLERAPGAAEATCTGGCSPGATSHAMVSPTGITADVGADFHHRFVGFNLQQRFAFAHTLAFFFSPRQQFPGFLRHLQRRHHHTDCHSFSVATIS